MTTNPIEDPKLVAEYPTIKGPNANLIREIRRERRIELALEGFRYDDIMRWNAMKLFENPKTYLGMRVTDKVKALYQPEVFEGSTARDLIEYNGKTYIRMYSGKSLNEAGRKWTGNYKRLYYPIPTSQDYIVCKPWFSSKTKSGLGINLIQEGRLAFPLYFPQ